MKIHPFSIPRKGDRRLSAFHAIFFAHQIGFFLVISSLESFAQSIEIDLDRNTPGIQATLEGYSPGTPIQGAIAVTGEPSDNVSLYAVEVRFGDASTAGTAIDCAHTTLDEGDVKDGPSFSVSEFCTETAFSRGSVFPQNIVPLGEDRTASLFHFDLFLLCPAGGEMIDLEFTPSTENAQLGFSYNGSTRVFGGGQGNPIPTVGARVICAGTAGPTPTPLPTFTPAPDCEDAGYYILDAFGGRHSVGDPLNIMGQLYYGRDVAVDMERFVAGTPKGSLQEPDLAVLDRFGAVQFVAHPSQLPGQDFYWPEDTSPACGFAVDVEVTTDGSGFWVLTEKGGVFRAGTAIPQGEGSQLGGDAAILCNILGIPFGGAIPRDPGFPSGDNAVLKAVGFIVVQSESNNIPAGFIVLDSQGGHFLFDGAGNFFSEDSPGSVLNDSTVYPFFPGLDIARDLELGISEPGSQSIGGLVILDGWGGVHPVPVGFTPGSHVSFLRNIPPARITTTGLPYVTQGFDDPETEGDESNESLFGADANSIFLDIEFCLAGDGVYVLDSFGGVFAFGNTRANPNRVEPRYTGGPYFFPNLYARDLEAQDIERETESAK